MRQRRPCLLVIILRSSVILQFVPSWNLAVFYLPVISQSQPLEEFWVSASSRGTDVFNKGRWPPSRIILALQHWRNINLFLLTRRKKLNGRHYVDICCVSLFVLRKLGIALMRKVYASPRSFARMSATCLILQSSQAIPSICKPSTEKPHWCVVIYKN